MDDAITRGLCWKIAIKGAQERNLNLFREYIVIIHDALERLQMFHDRLVANDLAKEPDGEQHRYIEMYHSEEGSKLAVTLPAMSNASTFVSVFSYLEHEMFELCSRLQKNTKQSLGVKDLAGTGIDQAANYLEKVCGLEDVRTTQAWEETKRLQQLRNVLVHRRGILKEVDGKNDPDKAIRSYAFEKGLLDDALGAEILLTKDFCLGAIDTVQSVLWILFDRTPHADMAGDPTA